MKKWRLWAIIALGSAANSALFYVLSLRAMERGIEDVDNQAALLFIPLLWFAALAVVLLLNLAVLLYGLRIRRGAVLHPVECFCAPARSEKARTARTVFEVFDCGMIALACLLFSGEGILTAAYALTGGLLLALLYVWVKAGQA